MTSIEMFPIKTRVIRCHSMSDYLIGTKNAGILPFWGECQFEVPTVNFTRHPFLPFLVALQENEAVVVLRARTPLES